MTTARPRPPTSAQVALKAGVSRTTVSFVLNGVRNQGISESTRAKVLSVAREMGYQPNAAARSLASGSTGTVALVIPKASHLYVDSFLAQLVATLNEACHHHGLKMLIESTDEEGREPGSFMNLVRERSIDGLIVANPRISEHSHLEHIAQAGIPLVVLTSRPDDLPGFFTVPSDTYLSAKTAVQHLLNLGHKKIAYVSFAQPEFDSVHEREIGWRAALTEAGHTPDPALVEYADISAQSGYEATRRLLARGVKFSALFAGNDTIAFGAIRALREAQLRVPEDVAIVGYDDIPIAAFASPPLTTMKSDPIGQAQTALKLLMDQFNGQVTPTETRPQTQAKLIIRSSCGATITPP
jgi:DNA-binding LacI/PurR family transcriptional regulator